MFQPIKEKLLWACDPLLGILRFKLRLSETTILILFFALFFALISASPILVSFASPDKIRKTLAEHFHILVGYPLFVCNVAIAFQYYRLLPRAFKRLIDAGFIHDEDVETAKVEVLATLRGTRRWLRSKNLAIYALSVCLVILFHALYLTDDKTNWLKSSSGNYLSFAGWLNIAFITAIISIALQFSWSVFSVSFLMRRVMLLAVHGRIRVNPWRFNLHRALRPFVTLFWLSCATLLPLFAFSILQALVVRNGSGDLWHLMQMWVFFPIVYFVLTPLMILGHLYPIYCMVEAEKTKMLDHLAHKNAAVLPTNATEFVRKHGWHNYKQRLEEAEIHEKLFAFIQKIPVLPLSLKKSILLLLPPLLDFLVKHFTSK